MKKFIAAAAAVIMIAAAVIAVYADATALSAPPASETVVNADRELYDSIPKLALEGGSGWSSAPSGDGGYISGSDSASLSITFDNGFDAAGAAWLCFLFETEAAACDITLSLSGYEYTLPSSVEALPDETPGGADDVTGTADTAAGHADTAADTDTGEAVTEAPPQPVLHSHTDRISVTPEALTGIFFDISAFGGNESIRSVTLTFTFPSGTPGWRISTPAVTADTSAVRTMRYICGEYTAVEGEITYTDSAMVFTVNGSDPYLQTHFLSYNGRGDGNALRLTLINNTSCRSVTLYCASEGSAEYSEKYSYTAELSVSLESQTCILPFTSDGIGRYMLVFNGNIKGDIQILSITPASTYAPSYASAGEITLCRINSARNKIMVEGTLGADADRYRGSPLRLYVTDMFTDESQLRPDAEYTAETVAGNTFSFLIDLFDSSGISRLNRKIVIGVLYNGRIHLIDTAEYVSNPEALASADTVFDTPASKKGAAFGIVKDVQLAGFSHISYKVDLSRLLTVSVTASPVTADGFTFYIDTEYADEIDRALSLCSDAGSLVTLILTANRSDDPTVNSVILHPDAEADTNCAFNTSSRRGIAALSALSSYIAQRWSVGGPVAAYCVGENVSRGRSAYDMGEATLAVYSENYCRAFRSVYNAVKSASPHVNVYLPLDSVWTTPVTASERTSFNSRDFLGAFAARIKDEGNIDWRIAFNPSPDNQEYYACLDDSAETGYSAGYITAANLDVLLSYITRTEFYYNGNYRPMILLQTDAPQGGDPSLRAADYVYTYCLLSTTNYSLCEAYITNDSYEGFDVLRDIDTDASQSCADFAAQRLKITSLTKIIPLFSSKRTAVTVTDGAPMTSVDPEGIIGSYVLLGSKGWDAGSNILSIIENASVGEQTDLLDLRPELDYGDVYAVASHKLDFAYDLTVSPIIFFEARVTSLTEGTPGAELIVRFSSGNNRFDATGIIPADGKVLMYVDLSAFAPLNSIDCVTVYIRGIDGTPLGRPSLMLSPIRVLSADYNSSELDAIFAEARRKATHTAVGETDMRVVWTLVGIIVLASSLLAVLQLSRHRKAAKR